MWLTVYIYFFFLGNTATDTAGWTRSDAISPSAAWNALSGDGGPLAPLTHDARQSGSAFKDASAAGQR